MMLTVNRNGVWSRKRLVTGASSGIDSSVASQASLNANHNAAPTHAATIDAVSTRDTLLVASGVARHTYHADRQTNE